MITPLADSNFQRREKIQTSQFNVYSYISKVYSKDKMKITNKKILWLFFLTSIIIFLFAPTCILYVIKKISKCKIERLEEMHTG